MAISPDCYKKFMTVFDPARGIEIISIVAKAT
jgi:hypothetical protein